jgi:phosphate acyltransferase
VKRKQLVGVDLMGSDNAPSALLSAAASLLPRLPSLIEIVAIGTPDCEKEALIRGLRFQPAHDAIGMEENPLIALRRKKQSSLCVGLRLLKEGKLDAFVSAGNTGALVSASKMILGTFREISRPALLALMPTKKRPVAVLDVGANLQAKASQLVQFAHLGAAYQKARGISDPRIGILNIGSEASKGTSEIRLAYKELSKLPAFAGNIEGKSVFDGEVDVLVTDGFTGNIFLKTAEGIANLVLDRLHARIPPSAQPAIQVHLDDLQRHLHYAEYPGALLAGVKGAVVKCHGYSTPEAFANGIRGAIEFASTHFVSILQDQLNT